jgi:UDP-4-amino-4,6-dideoxy-N-acetyl-beta-L-altrosamine N-acetyltransferase
MKNFIDITDEESIMILKWRNHNGVRVNMLNNNEITKEEHFNFIESLKDENSKQYFLIDNIGVIYFTNIKDNTAEIGLYSNPTKYGVGKTLIDNLLSFNYKTLYLEVLKDNLNAIKLYKRYNFKEYKKKDSLNNNIIYMELKNENRKF